jgi:protein-L-isoaspartate O-methyltransferase
MLESLDIHTGMRVLEVGTGTGYNAALLCHRLGAENVCSIDIEPDLVATAGDRLAALGYRPFLVAGDGADGVARHAPFDRLVATCAVSAVPWPWIEQTALGGKILTDVKVGLSAGNLVLLDRIGKHRAEGRFDSGQAAFMQLRPRPGFAGETLFTRASEYGPADTSSTMLDPRIPWTNPVTWFLAVLRIGPHFRLGYLGADPRRAPTSVVLSTPDGSRCEVDIETYADGSHAIRKAGPTRLWHHVEHAHRLWQEHGEPSWSRLGLTVTPESQTIFVDEPATVIAALPNRR